MVLKFSNFLKIKVSYYSSKYKQYLCHLRQDTVVINVAPTNHCCLPR